MKENVTIVGEGNVVINFVQAEIDFLKRLISNISVSVNDPDGVNSLICLKSILEKIEASSKNQ